MRYQESYTQQDVEEILSNKLREIQLLLERFAAANDEGSDWIEGRCSAFELAADHCKRMADIYTPEGK
jgi:hypothetical protein